VGTGLFILYGDDQSVQRMQNNAGIEYVRNNFDQDIACQKM
jgi:hypothetical protein